MEQKQIEGLVEKARYIRSFFRPLDELEELARELQAAQNYPAEMEKAGLGKKKELDGLEIEVETARKANAKELSSLASQLNKVKADLAKSEGLLREQDQEIAKRTEKLQTLKAEADKAAVEHEQEIEALAQEERALTQRIEKAKGVLAEIKAKLV